MSKTPSIEGSATVTPTPVPVVVHADWTVDPKQKTSSAQIMGGQAVISRHPDTEKFFCWFKLEIPAEDVDEAPGRIEIKVPLHNCGRLVEAQERAEVLIRETLRKTQPGLAHEQEVAEQVQRLDTSEADPF